jgi:hypothetical protein
MFTTHTHTTRTAHARFLLASALVRLAIRVCPRFFVSRFVEETVELAEELAEARYDHASAFYLRD